MEPKRKPNNPGKHLDRLMKEIEGSGSSEMLTLLERKSFYSISIGVRSDQRRGQVSFLEISLDINDPSGENRLDRFRSVHLLIGDLIGSGFVITTMDGGVISCEKEVDSGSIERDHSELISILEMVIE